MKKITRKCGPITLGETYTDIVHNRSGVAICYAIHLTGCNRVCLEWVNNDGEVKDIWVDESRLVDKHQKPLVAEEAEAGPGSDPPKRGIR